MQIPTADINGSFEKVLPASSEEWPWALPQYFAVNIVSDPGITIVGWTASPDGKNAPREAFNPERTKVETIGFWHNDYRITNSTVFSRRTDAELSAKNTFSSIPTKYLMHNGQIVEENKGLRLTGTWPLVWNFLEIRDIGLFLCYLVMLAQEKGENERAQRVKDTILPAWPPTELILNYQRSLQYAKQEMTFLLDKKTNLFLDNAIYITQNWLKG